MNEAPADTECPHGLGERAWCVICNGRDQAERKAQQSRTRAFDARYISTCPECKRIITVGQSIVIERSTGKAVHEECTLNDMIGR